MSVEFFTYITTEGGMELGSLQAGEKAFTKARFG
jgi:hypothetical protein